MRRSCKENPRAANVIRLSTSSLCLLNRTPIQVNYQQRLSLKHGRAHCTVDRNQKARTGRPI